MMAAEVFLRLRHADPPSDSVIGGHSGCLVCYCFTNDVTMVHFCQICLVGKRARGDTGFLGHVRQTGIMSSDILTTKLVHVGK